MRGSMGHDKMRRTSAIKRMRDAARAKRAAVVARHATAAADTSQGLHIGTGGAYVPRVTLLLAGAAASRR